MDVGEPDFVNIKAAEFTDAGGQKKPPTIFNCLS
jgi:hypothetical protein